MDDFRMHQKAQVGDGSQRGWHRPYGCDCCNQGCKRHRKVSQRRLAKTRFRLSTKRLITDET